MWCRARLFVIALLGTLVVASCGEQGPTKGQQSQGARPRTEQATKSTTGEDPVKTARAEGDPESPDAAAVRVGKSAAASEGSMATLGVVQLGLGIAAVVLLLIITVRNSRGLQEMRRLSDNQRSMDQRLDWLIQKSDTRPEVPRPTQAISSPDISALHNELTISRKNIIDLEAEIRRLREEEKTHLMKAEELRRRLAAYQPYDQVLRIPQFSGLDDALSRLAALCNGPSKAQRALGREAETVKYALEQVKRTRAVTTGDATNLSARRAYWSPTDPETSGWSVLLDYCRGMALTEVARIVGGSVVAPERGDEFRPEHHIEDGEAAPDSPELAGKVAQCRQIGFEGHVKARVQRFGRFEASTSAIIEPMQAGVAPLTTVPATVASEAPMEPPATTVPTAAMPDESDVVEDPTLSLDSIEGMDRGQGL